jgi:serine phosphatase RsbU (regulator of sigma subunit)/CheY-like chemotaxis protein
MFTEDESFDSLFAEEDSTVAEDSSGGQRWKILIVDDEEGIHSAMKLALGDFAFEGKRLHFFDAYSSEEAKGILIDNPDIALVLLDVVMETEDAGLNYVKFIRDKLKNQFIRIVLWTGQPGHAPKKEVILSYEINDYKSKTDLSDENIFTAVLSSLRSYNAMMTIESYRLNLEEKVKERTKKIEEQKTKITDSISYAKKIQEAMLPSDKLIKSHFPDSFILFSPKDIVSGDFYWFAQPETDEWGKPNEKLFIAAADCTGHGVPGAFMSMIGNTLLNEIVNSKKIFSPSDILKELNQGVIEALNQKNPENEDSQSDGMDITVCQIDKAAGTIQIACANHVVLVVNEEGAKIIEGDIFSIGGMFSVLRTPTYTNHTIFIEGSTSLYMFSDGYQDQFGGPKNQKFMFNRMQELMVSIQDSSMQEQHAALTAELDKWKGDQRQIDDILVMGIKLNN